MKGLPPKLEVYRCRFCVEENDCYACGFNGCSLDNSYYDCHHPLDLKTAERIAVCYNALHGIEDPQAYTKSVEALVIAVKASRIVPYPALQQLCDEVLEHRQFEIPS